MFCTLLAVLEVREVCRPTSLRKRLLNCQDDGGIGLHEWLTFQIRQSFAVEPFLILLPIFLSRHFLSVLVGSSRPSYCSVASVLRGTENVSVVRAGNICLTAQKLKITLRKLQNGKMNARGVSLPILPAILGQNCFYLGAPLRSKVADDDAIDVVCRDLGCRLDLHGGGF